MTTLEQTHSRAIDALAAITDGHRAWGAPPPDPDLLHNAINAITEYTLAVALDRMAARGCDASAEKLALVFLPDQRHSHSFPP